jgi:putative hydrolase of the HAD superfamily
MWYADGDSCFGAVCAVLQGLRKPDPAAFEVVVNTLQKPSQQLVFVDDRKVNVEAAVTSGLKALHFTGNVEELERQLLDLGVAGL